MKLSVVIPSYNRNAILLNTLPILLEQLRPNVELCILDNCSSTPLAETLAGLMDRYSSANVKIIRHVSNIGGDANILRSFEVVCSPWIWILGDDDLISPNAIDIILQTIDDHPDCVFVNFATSTMREKGLRPKSFDSVGQAGFVENLDYPGNVNFMSVGIWNVSSALPSMYKAYKYIYSMSPTYSLLLTILGDTGRCHFSDRVLVDTVTTADASTKWHFGDFILGWNTILELPMADGTRRVLARKMYSWHAPENVCVYLLAEAAYRNEGGRRFALVSHRLAPYISSFARLRYRVYQFLFLAPSFSWPIVAAIIRLSVRLKIKGVDLADILERARYL